jgi:hypothetical protein
MKERPEHLPLGIMPKSAKIKGLNIFIKPEAVNGVLGFFFGKGVAEKDPINVKERQQHENTGEGDKQTLLKR